MNKKQVLNYDLQLTDGKEVTTVATLSMEVGINVNISENTLRIRELSKWATAYHNAEINKAIKCLEEVWVICFNSLSDFDLQKLLRLPKFLQEAGRFIESKDKFQQLIDIADTYNYFVCDSHDLTEFYFAASKNNFLAEIYDAMRIVYKREKQIDLSNHWKELSKKHRLIAHEYSCTLQEVRKRQLDEYKKWKENMRNEQLPDLNKAKWEPKF